MLQLAIFNQLLQTIILFTDALVLLTETFSVLETIFVQIVSVFLKRDYLCHAFLDEMSEIKDKILSGAETLFLRYGFKSITMDDVARELGVSKKTLYQFFVDKNDLVHHCVEHHMENMNTMCSAVAKDNSLDAVSVIFEITEQMNAVIRQLNPSSMFDLKKYFKSAWDKLESERKSFIKRTMLDNLQQGKKEGLYKPELDPEITSDIYIHLMGYLTNPENHHGQPADLKTMHFELIKYHLRSICTSQGLALMNKKFK